ncbi:SusC/RagA family TonB-linked outer membrane protein [Flavobacterium ovatum]|uniref:SusC/RagA family TonB-linked outer membrane protein n=1 Tax=Flavobacterium ovatum TaxID=1928857 RepID=UPI00344E98CB
MKAFQTILDPRSMFVLVLLFLFSGTAVVFAQDNVIKGSITNKENTPLESVLITVVGTKDAALTNSNGIFSIRTKPSFPLRLKIHLEGYTAKEVSLNSAEFVTILLESNNNSLDEVVVSSGYIIQKKTEISGAVASISAKQIQNRPTTSFDQLLGGQATGIDVLQSSGVLNSTPVMRIRGLNTITSGLFPLVVVDGVSVFVGSIGGMTGNNPLSDINPNDIQTIDVLKDASASAIYGSRAANGVIVITTKKGKIGKTKFNYDSWYSVNTPYNLPKLLGAEDYVMIKNEAMVNAGKAPGYFLSYNPDGSVVDTNWYDVAYRSGFSNNHNLNISGANETTDYYFSVGYSNQNSFIRNNSFERYFSRLNINHKVNHYLKVGATLSYSNGMNTSPNTGAISSNTTASSAYNTEYITNEPIGRMTYVLPPNVPVYNNDGSYSVQNGTSVGYGANVPLLIGTINAYNLAMVQDLDINSSQNNALLGNVYAEIDINEYLKFKTSYGLNNLQVTNKSFLNPVHGGGASSNGVATNIQSKYLRKDWINTLTYTKDFSSKNHFNMLLGQEQIKTTTDSWGATQSNITDPSYSNYQGGFINISPIGNLYGENGLASYFSNINYNFDKRYFVSINARRDGLSALADGNKYGNFGSGSVSWAVSQERFYQQMAVSKVINSLKFRTSYGVVGNSEIGDYPSIGTYSSGTYAGSPTLGYSQTANPNLKWETSTKLDLGLNFALLDNRITVEFDYYKNTIKDLILKAPQALSAGIPNNYINANIGGMYNKGFELGINALVLDKSDFKWNASLNLSTLKNEVTSLASDVFVPSVFGVQNMTRVGYSVGSIFAVPTKGVNPDNGQMVFINSKGQEVQYNHIGSPKWTFLDGTAAPAIDNYTDGVIQGPSLPKVFGGLNNSFKYKNFDMNVNFTFVSGSKLYNGTRATNSDQRYFNNGEFIKNRWTTPGQITDIQKLYYGDNVSAGFSFTATSKVEDGSYIKLKNISVGYHIPIQKTFLRNSLSSIYLYLQAANVYTWTKYRGADPEVSINGNSINSGKDQNVPPNAQVGTFGINVGF